MLIKDSLITTFSAKVYKLSEELMHLNLVMKEISSLPDFQTLNIALSDIPIRDNWSLSIITTCDDLLTIRSNQYLEARKKAYCEFIDQVSEYDDLYEVTIHIEKQIIENTLSIYRFQDFASKLLSGNLIETIHSFSYILLGNEYIIFEVLDRDVFLSTKTMVFKGLGNDPIVKYFERSKRISETKSLSYFYMDTNFHLLPDDFHIEYDTPNNPFRELFLKLEVIMSLMYIASSATIENSNLKLLISGQRNLEMSIDINQAIPKNDELYKIYNWIYTEGNSADKALLARNIISLHCKYSRLQDINEQVYLTILANFRLYLKENLNQYLQLKNSVSQYITEILTQIGDRASEILKNFKTNLFAILGFLLTVVIANIVSEQPLANIFTKDISLIFEVVLFASLIYLVISIIEVIYKLNRMKEGYGALKKNYTPVFSDSELKDLFSCDSEFSKSVNRVVKGIKIFSFIWLLFIIITFILVERFGTSPWTWPTVLQNTISLP